MLGHLIVAHLRDGTVLKGKSLDVDAKKPTCFIRPRGSEPVEIALGDTKALFFVKTEEGRPGYKEATAATSGDVRLVGAKKVRVRFQDGEEVVGLMNRFPPIQPFFYMLPIDPASNNIRILVNRAAVVDMQAMNGGGA